MAQRVKNSPATQEVWVWSLGQEDPLKEEMATHSSILAGIIPWTEESGRLQSIGLQRVRMTEATEHTQTHMHTHGRVKWANIHGCLAHGKCLVYVNYFPSCLPIVYFLFTLFWDLNAPTPFLGQSALKCSMNGWRQETGTMGNTHIFALYYISSIQNCVWHILGAQCIPFESINRQINPKSSFGIL